MLKELLSTALMSFNIVNAQPIINKTNQAEFINYAQRYDMNITISFSYDIEIRSHHINVFWTYSDMADYSETTLPSYSELGSFFAQKDHEYMGCEYNLLGSSLGFTNKVNYSETSDFGLYFTGLVLFGYINYVGDINTPIQYDESNVSYILTEPESDDGSNLICRYNFEEPLAGDGYNQIHYTALIGVYDNGIGRNLHTSDLTMKQNFVLNYEEPPIINQEVIDLPSLIFSIIGLPFTFINNAFNLTLFQGTAYQVNVRDVVMLIIGGMVLLLIIKKIMELKG